METTMSYLCRCVRRSIVSGAIVSLGLISLSGCDRAPTAEGGAVAQAEETPPPSKPVAEAPPADAPAGEPAKDDQPAPEKPPEIIKVKLTGNALRDAYVLGVYENDELIRIERSEPVYLALLARKGLERKWRTEAIEGLAKLRKTSPLAELVAGLAYVDENAEDEDTSVLAEVGDMLLAHDAAALANQRDALATFVENASRSQAKRIALAAIVTADNSTGKAWKFAEENSYIVDLLGALPLVRSGKLRATLFEQAKSQLADAFDEEARAASMNALASMEGREADVFAILAEKASDFEAGPSAISALLAVANKDAWPKGKLVPLADTLVAAIKEMPEADRNTPQGKNAVALAEAIAKRVAAADSKRINDALGELIVRTIELGTVDKQMIYDQKVLVARAGKPLQIVLTNHDEMPHNIVFLRMTSTADDAAKVTMEKVALATEALVRMAGAEQANYVPEMEEVIAGSEMIQSKEDGRLTFTVPDKPGVYPFICTFPGHWTKMYGALVVVEDVDAYLSAHNPLPTAESRLPGLREPVPKDPEHLLKMLAEVTSGRSFEQGKQVFESTSNCMSCHRMKGKGGLIGPELTEVNKKYKPHEIAREIILPSKVINEKFNPVNIVIAGKIYQGLIVEETDKVWKLKPLEKLQIECEPTIINKEDFEEGEDEFAKLTTSPMPDGMMDFLTEEEIKDLYAYVLSGGDPQHPVFAK